MEEEDKWHGLSQDSGFRHIWARTPALPPLYRSNFTALSPTSSSLNGDVGDDTYAGNEGGWVEGEKAFPECLLVGACELWPRPYDSRFSVISTTWPFSPSQAKRALLPGNLQLAEWLGRCHHSHACCSQLRGPSLHFQKRMPAGSTV